MGKYKSKHLFFVDDFKEIEICGNKAYQMVGSDYCKPSDFGRMHYTKHNFCECENCKVRHAELIMDMAESFKKFPNCCEPHSRLLKAKWFNRGDFEQAPQLYADKLYYTWDHILQFIEDENWNEEIIDFIEYIFNTFGSFPINYGEPINFSRFTCQLGEMVEQLPNKEKNKVILQFIREYGKPTTNKQSDFNVLVSTYNEWFKTFPFDLSFFAHLKPYFAKHIPIVEKTHTNKYLGLTKAKLRSKENLIDFLLQVTEKIISEINTAILYEQGKIHNIDQVNIELLVQKRKQKINKGYDNQSKDSNTRYRKILKAWLKDEIEFIKALLPLVERISIKRDTLHEAVINACYKIQESKIFWTADENARTRHILNLLPEYYFTKDQSQYGESPTGKKPGEIDGVVIDMNNTEYFLEAFNLSSLDRKLIHDHIIKLEGNYDAKGVSNKYVLVYCNIADGTFAVLSDKYFQFLQLEMNFKFKLTSVNRRNTKYTNICDIQSIHEREGKQVFINHLLIKMPIK